jgi:hypothetical protein
MVMSNIRQNRIDKVWNNSRGGPQEIGRNAFNLWQDWYAMYGLHHSRNNVARGQEIVILERGNEGWLKCNIDAAFHEGVGITSFG